MNTVISPAQRTHFDTFGYVVVPDAVPTEQCRRVVDAIWEFTGYSPDDPAGWYGPPAGLSERWPVQEYGMIPLFSHQSLWDNRQHPRVHRAFAELVGHEELWVSIDRVNMKPPARDGDPQPTDRLVHWDVDTAGTTFPLPLPRPVQGVLCLTDTTADQGGFHCVPELFRGFREWLADQPGDRDTWQPGPVPYERVSIEANAGDLIVWDSILAHGNGVNRSDRVRFAQYITMTPATPGVTRDDETATWRDRTHPRWATGDPRGWEGRQPSATLTALGERLLGKVAWP